MLKQKINNITAGYYIVKQYFKAYRLCALMCNDEDEDESAG